MGIYGGDGGKKFPFAGESGEVIRRTAPREKVASVMIKIDI
jgi:hypothetical protein